MKSNKICSKLRKGANFAAANLQLRPRKTTMTVLWNTSFIVPLTLAVWHRSIDLVPLWAAEWTESDKHIKLIDLMTITMKKNNSDQTKGKPWTESVNFHCLTLYLQNAIMFSQIICCFSAFWCWFKGPTAPI